MENLKFRRPSAIPRTKRRPNRSSRYIISVERFRLGDVYLFHKTDRNCPSKSSLWGIFDKREGDEIYLESSSNGNLRRFKLWHRLPYDYEYCRLATRQELGNFMFALAWFESRARK